MSSEYRSVLMTTQYHMMEPKQGKVSN